MRPKTITINSANSPYVIPVDYRAPQTVIDAKVTGTINYTATTTVQNVYGITTPATNANWVATTNMAGATATAQEVVSKSINAVKVVVNSGAGSVDVTISQPDAF